MKFTGILSVVLTWRYKCLRNLSSSFNHRFAVSDIGDGIKNVELNRPYLYHCIILYYTTYIITYKLLVRFSTCPALFTLYSIIVARRLGRSE